MAAKARDKNRTRVAIAQKTLIFAAASGNLFAVVLELMNLLESCFENVACDVIAGAVTMIAYSKKALRQRKSSI